MLKVEMIGTKPNLQLFPKKTIGIILKMNQSFLNKHQSFFI